jgi:competence protein ComEC
MSVNDASLVLRLAYGGRAVLFPGDLEGAGEGELVGRGSVGQAINADVLKVPHHGSRTSSSAELLDATQPTLAIASLGWQNRFHFPARPVLDRYAARGVRLLRTDLHGAVTVTISGAGALSVQCQRGCQ